MVVSVSIHTSWQMWLFVMVEDNSPVSCSSLMMSNHCPCIHRPSKTFCQLSVQFLSPCQHQHHFLPISHSFLLTHSSHAGSLSFQSTSLSSLKSTHRYSSP